jgi:hypothetical protein
MLRTDNDDAWEIINGKKVLRDGHKVTVPLRLRDAMRDRPRIRDGRGNAPGHKPGFLISDANADAKRRAYADYERDLANAYKDQPSAGAYPLTAAAEGSACTIDGWPGTLQRRGDWLVCVPNKQSFNGGNGGDDPDAASDSIKDHRQRMAQLYSAYDADLQNKWRTG